MGKHEPLGPDFAWKLRRALQRIEPPTPLVVMARYQLPVAAPRRRSLRLATALAATLAALVAALGTVTATVSPAANFARQVVTTIESATHVPLVGPTSEPSPEPGRGTQATSANLVPQPSSGQSSIANASPPPSRSDPHLQSPGEGEDHRWPSPTPSDGPRESPRPDQGGDHHESSPHGGWPSSQPYPSPDWSHDGHH